MAHWQYTLHKASRRLIMSQGLIYSEYANSPIYPVGYTFYGEQGTVVTSPSGTYEMPTLGTSSVTHPIVWILDANFNRTNKFFMQPDVHTVGFGTTKTKSRVQNAFSGFYNAKFDPEDVQFAFAPESSLFNPKSLREACGNEPICGVPKNWFKSCWTKRDAWQQCRTAWMASNATLVSSSGENNGSGGSSVGNGGGTAGTRPGDEPVGGIEPDAEKREQKTNVWLWVSAIMGFIIFIFIIIFLIKQFNK